MTYINRNKILPILYRTFDVRFIVYDSKVVTRIRTQVMRNILLGDNLGLITVRQVAEGIFNHVFITQVLDKWLKERKKANRSLNCNDIFHYQKIVVAVKKNQRINDRN